MWNQKFTIPKKQIKYEDKSTQTINTPISVLNAAEVKSAELILERKLLEQKYKIVHDDV